MLCPTVCSSPALPPLPGKGGAQHPRGGAPGRSWAHSTLRACRVVSGPVSQSGLSELSVPTQVPEVCSQLGDRIENSTWFLFLCLLREPLLRSLCWVLAEGQWPLCPICQGGSGRSSGHSAHSCAVIHPAQPLRLPCGQRVSTCAVRCLWAGLGLHRWLLSCFVLPSSCCPLSWLPSARLRVRRRIVGTRHSQPLCPVLHCGSPRGLDTCRPSPGRAPAEPLAWSLWSPALGLLPAGSVPRVVLGPDVSLRFSRKQSYRPGLVGWQGWHRCLGCTLCVGSFQLPFLCLVSVSLLPVTLCPGGACLPPRGWVQGSGPSDFRQLQLLTLWTFPEQVCS